MSSYISEKLTELPQYRQLLYYFAWRDLKVRYKQTLIGVFWVVLQPIALMAIFSVFLSQIGRDAADNVPYPVYLYAALVFWGYFSSVVNTVSASVVSNSALIKKIYFPRIIPALASVLVASVDFLVAFMVFVILFPIFGTEINLLGFALLPLLVLVTVMSALGFGLFFAALNVRYRDVKQALPFIMQALFFLTPVIYPFSIVPTELQTLLFLNPMTGVVVTARDAFLIGSVTEPEGLLMAILISLLMLYIGTKVFYNQEPEFVDAL